MKLCTSVLALAVLAIGGTFASQASAAPLNLISKSPDVTSSAMQLTYTPNGNGGVLSVTGGIATSLDGSTSITNGQFILSVTLTHQSGSGSTESFTYSNASLAVTGKVGGVAHTFFNSSVLSNFGYTTSAGSLAPQTFEFVFAPTTGSDYGLGGVGVILHTPLSTAYIGGTPNYFAATFNNTVLDTQFTPLYVNATADTFAVPEPASLGMLAAAAPMLLRRRRKA